MFNPCNTVSFIIVFTLFLVIGWFTQQQILKQNQCEMTFSSPKVKQENFQRDRKDGYTLWKFEDGLNMQPVLFIPGHKGSTMQARSLASYMHNKEGIFQYFTVGFGEEASAYHASSIISQAVYVNEAIKYIRVLYKSKYRDPPRLIVAAHSLGGMVARTALTLQSHPKDCPVNAIVMFGSPNREPAYSPDASMEVLYSVINTAWKKSYFPYSDDCKLRQGKDLAKGISERDAMERQNAQKGGNVNNGRARDNESKAKDRISTNWLAKVPYCMY